MIPSLTNPQSWNRYGYVLNNPINASDPTGHKCVGETDECKNDKGTTINGAGGLTPKPKHDPDHKHNPLSGMKAGDIITFELSINGETMTRNFMLGLLEDGSWGFWDLDSHSYVPFELAVNMVDGANSWTTFQKTDPKTFNSYAVMNSAGTPAALPSYDVNWTGGMDDNPAYVEIHTDFDWDNAPSEFGWAVGGPAWVTLYWGNAKPTVTPLSQTGYWPLTEYIKALAYFYNDGVALNRYPIIHP